MGSQMRQDFEADSWTTYKNHIWEGVLGNHTKIILQILAEPLSNHIWFFNIKKRQHGLCTIFCVTNSIESKSKSG